MEEIAIRVFGSEKCVVCKSVKKAFEFYAIKYDYVDADDPQNEKFCDDHNVEELPHIEAFFPKINKTFYVKKGYISPTTFLNLAIKEVENLENELIDETKSKIEDLNKIEIQKMMLTSQEKKKCNSCSRNKNAK
jgi:hypothetical protein